MAYTDEQKTRRFELENQQTPLNTSERFLLAALNDLRDADQSGDRIDECERAVKQAEAAVAKEKKQDNVIISGEQVLVDGHEIIAGGHAVETLKNTLQ